MKEVWNFATIEFVPDLALSQHIPIGVLASPASRLDVAIALDLDKVDQYCHDEEMIETARAEIGFKLDTARREGVDGLRLFRSITAPRRSPIVIIPRGTKFAEDGGVLVTEIAERYSLTVGGYHDADLGISAITS